jgi:hypothetical protein
MRTDNFSLQNKIIQTSQTGGQRFSDASPFSIPSLYNKTTCGSNLFFSVISLRVCLIFAEGAIFEVLSVEVRLTSQ